LQTAERGERGLLVRLSLSVKLAPATRWGMITMKRFPASSQLLKKPLDQWLSTGFA